MVSQSKASDSLRRLLSKRLERDEMWKITSVYRKHEGPVTDNDRAAALVLTAVLEQALEDALLTHMPYIGDEKSMLFGGSSEEEGLAPMSTFGAKIWTGYALGIYGPNSRRDLTTIKNIRNLFAHAKEHIDFNSDLIPDLCSGMYMLQRIPVEDRLTDPREIFFDVTRHYFAYFTYPLFEEPIRYKGMKGHPGTEAVYG